MAAVFGQPAPGTAQNPQYQQLAQAMAGLQGQMAKPGALPGNAVAGKPGMLPGNVEMAFDSPSPLGMEKGGYTGPAFKPGQTVTADQLPAWNEWMAAGMPGTPASQMPQAPAAPATPAQAAQSYGPQGFSTGAAVGATDGAQGLPGITSTAVDYQTLPGLDTDFSGMGDRVRSAMFQRTSGLLNPEHERAREATAQRLANAGIVEGSERWTEEMNRLDQQRALSLERAGLDADIAAGDEMGRLFGQALAARQQLGGERERGADRTFGQSLGIRSQLAGEQLQRAGIDASIANAAAQAGAVSSGHALQAAQAAAANDIARGRLGLDQDNQGFNQWLLASQFARGGVNMPNFGTPIPLDVTGAAGVAQQGANAQAGADAARNAGYWGLASALLPGMLGGKVKAP